MKVMLKRLGYYGMVLLMVPFLWLATALALIEIVIGGDGRMAAWVARPFTWSIRRGKKPAWQRPPYRRGKAPP